MSHSCLNAYIAEAIGDQGMEHFILNFIILKVKFCFHWLSLADYIIAPGTLIILAHSLSVVIIAATGAQNWVQIWLLNVQVKLFIIYSKCQQLNQAVTKLSRALF